MSLPPFSKQQLKMSTTAKTAETLPMAELGQLQWVKRPLSSLSNLACSKEVPSSTSHVDSQKDVPSLWWPSLLFNDYDDFQDFFADEFDKSNIENNDASETKGLILSRMLQNMRQQRTIMVARLLGRSIREYVEIVEIPVEGLGGEEEAKNDALDVQVESHQATEFVSFTRMPQEVYLPQMEPEAFIVASNNTLTDDDSSMSNEATTVIDDDLYMSYMHALDLASTKRMCGPQAPFHSLPSEFREKGRVKLAKLPPSVQKFSETAYVSSFLDADAPVIPTEGVQILEKQEPDEDEEKSEEDSGDNDTYTEGESENKDMFEENIDQTMDTNEVMAVEGIHSTVPSEQEKKTQAEVADTVQPETQAEETACEASATGNTANGDSVKRGNEGDDNTDMNDASSLSATVISQSSDGPEGSDIGTSSSLSSPATASTNLRPRNKTNKGDATKTIDLPETQNEKENAGSKSSATSPATTPIRSPQKKPNTNSKEDISITQSAVHSPATTQRKSSSKKRKGGREIKAILPNTRGKEGVARTRSVVNSPTISSNNSSPRRTNRRVLPKRKVVLPEESSEEDLARTQSLAKSPTVSSVNSSPRRTNRRVLPKSKVVLPEEPSEERGSETKSLSNNPPAPSVNTSPLKKAKRRVSPRKKVGLLDKSSKKNDGGTLLLNSPTPVPISSPPPKKIKRHISINKGDLPKVNDKDVERDASIEDLNQDSPATTRSDSSEKTKEHDSTNSTQGVDTIVDKPCLPTCSPETRAVSILASPSQNSFNVDDNGITSDDSFDEVCHKLEYDGWTIDKYEFTYYSPSVGYDDIEMNPQWRGKKYFLSKVDFLVYLKATFGWTEKKTKTPTKKRGRGISNAVTPTFSGRPKRNRRSPTVSGESNTPKEKPKQFDFESADEEVFYNFPNLMPKLKEILGWQYLPARTRSWHYVLPGCRRESRGGEHLEDFLFEEAEVIQYCVNKKFYERRQELGLDDDNV